MQIKFFLQENEHRDVEYLAMKIITMELLIYDVVLDVNTIKSRHEISNNVVCATSNASDQPAHTCSLIIAFASRLNSLDC